MGRISPRAADAIKETIQKVRGLPPTGAGFADIPRILLARTTEAHNQGETKDVRLWWGEFGDELGGTERQDLVQAYNRFVDLEADEWVHIARIGPGWEIITARRPASSGTFCGGCSPGAGTNDIDLSGVQAGLTASEFYDFDPFCEGHILFTFVHSSGGTWNGTADSLTAVCNASPLTFSATLTVGSIAPGGVVVVLNDGTNDYTFENDVAWQSRQRVPLTFVNADAQCPCAPFRSFPCLVPRDSA